MKINEARFRECYHAKAKKAVGMAAIIALASAVGSFFCYLTAWRNGTGAVPDALEYGIENPDKEEEEET